MSVEGTAMGSLTYVMGRFEGFEGLGGRAKIALRGDASGRLDWLDVDDGLGEGDQLLGLEGFGDVAAYL